LSHKTFIASFFSWAALQQRDFLKPCHGCGWDLQLLVGDGTCTGCKLSTAHFFPVEQVTRGVDAVPPQLRRYDRTVIPHTGDAATQAAIKDLRVAVVNVARAVRKVFVLFFASSLKHIDLDCLWLALVGSFLFSVVMGKNN
jgi:hypothetical protein